MLCLAMEPGFEGGGGALDDGGGDTGLSEEGVEGEDDDVAGAFDGVVGCSGVLSCSGSSFFFSSFPFPFGGASWGAFALIHLGAFTEVPLRTNAADDAEK
jgi:hypothetical protein